jgi:hypothetical protein
MKIRQTVFITVLFLILGVAMSRLAQAQDAIAVITELKFNRGDIQLRSAAGAAPTKPAVLQSLYAGNLVQVTKDAVAVIFFTDGSRSVSVDDKNPSFEVRAAPVKSAAGGTVKEVASLLVGKKKPPAYVALSVRGKPQPPTQLSPRNSKILNDTPTFHWMGMDQQPATVKVHGAEGVVWSAENVNLTKLAYPASAPKLQADIEYNWTIEKKGFAPVKTTFRLLKAADAQAVMTRLNELNSMAGVSKTTSAVLRANFLMSKELYSDAREVLIEAIAADSDEPTLHFVLGELYDKIGLKGLANEEFNEAEFLAKAKQ